MKMNFSVVYDDGRKVTTTAKPKDLVAFERQYGKPVSAFQDGAALEWVYYLAWSALHRTGQEPRDFDGFLDIVEDVESEDEETPAAAADPSSPEASPDSSSS